MTVTELLKQPDFLHFVAERATEEDRARFGPLLQRLNEEQRYDWEPRLRDKQRWPDGDWTAELKLAGRGFGKTLSGAVWVKNKLQTPGTRVAILALTAADARDTCIEGDSGLLSVLPPETVKTWNRSLGELIMVNGSRVKLFTGDEPDRLRGPQHHFAWVDELAAFRYPEAWDQLQFGLRLGERPQVMVTTTPKPTKLIRKLVADDDVHVTRGSTFENEDNLAPSALASLKKEYEGTRLGRQELEAELLLDNPGALWTFDLIDSSRLTSDGPQMVKLSVNVDPSGGSGPNNDEQGIVVTGKGIDGHGYTIADLSCSLSPNGWGRRAVQAYLDYKADKIIVERNFGGDMARDTIERAAQDMGVQVVVDDFPSSRGKRLRAEPVAAMYEQGRWHHLGRFEKLEDQMCEWTPESGTSPDRLDALVFGGNYLFGTEEKRGFVLVQ